MAFSNTLQHEIPVGSMRMTMGTFTSTSGSTGGDLRTGLQKVLQMQLQATGSSVVADAPVVYETLPVVDPVTIVTTANTCGIWVAFGW